jgi:spermidine/putrescine transport system substrate-binding protein
MTKSIEKNTPNTETQKAINDARNGKVNHAKNVSDLMNKLRIVVVLLLAGIFFQGCQSGDKDRHQILKIYNWADYIDEDLLEEFPKWYKEQTGEDVRIVYQVFDMNEVMYTKIALGQEDFDLACPTQAVIERMMHNDLVLPIQKEFGTSPKYLDNLSPFIMERLDAFSMKNMTAADYVVPYMWGTSGIMYNTELISKEEVSSWASMWDVKNKGKILMKDSYWDAYNMAAIYGYRDQIASGERSVYSAVNDHTDQDIAMVEDLLKQLKPNLAGWEADFGKEMMTKGKIWMCYAWSGDAVWAIEEAADVNVSLDYIVPSEGSNIWFDGWVIPKYARNVKAASYFMNYICQPEIALRNMDVSGYTSAVATPEILEEQIDSSLTETVNLSYFFGEGHDSLLVNPIQYPDASIVERSAIILDFLDKNEQILEMWSRAKGDNLFSGMSYLIIAVLLIVVGLVVFRFLKKRKTSKRQTKRRKK